MLNESQSDKKKDYPSWIQALSSIITVSIAFYLLLRDNTNLKQQQEQDILLNRAYLNVSSISVSKCESFSCLTVLVLNTGKTPANNVHNNVRIETLSDFNRSYLLNPEATTSQADINIIGPGQIRRSEIRLDRNLKNEEYIFLVIHYNDYQKNPHTLISQFILDNRSSNGLLIKNMEER